MQAEQEGETQLAPSIFRVVVVAALLSVSQCRLKKKCLAWIVRV